MPAESYRPGSSFRNRRLSARTLRWVYPLVMRQIALGFFLAGLALHAQPDLMTQAPAVIARCAPQYTAEAKRANLEGTVVLYIQVYPDGKAHNIKVQRGLGSGLDETAIEAVKQWRFSPGTKYGKPVVVTATIEVIFRLNETSERCRAAPPQIEAKPQNGRA